jgi:hypothetical protein
VIALGLLVSITSYFAILLAIAVWLVDFTAFRDKLGSLIATGE